MEVIIKERYTGDVIASGQDEAGLRQFEGNWYFSPEAVSMTHLRVTDRTYTCPYKGTCYWIDVEGPNGAITRNVAWVYQNPKPGYEFIKDEIGFYARSSAGTTIEKL